MPCPASLARACTQFSCSCLKHLRKTTCVICNLMQFNAIYVLPQAAPKVDMASRRHFDTAYLVRGSPEKAWITCSKLDKKIGLMTRQYSSTLKLSNPLSTRHWPRLISSPSGSCSSSRLSYSEAKAEPKHFANDKQKSQCCDYRRCVDFLVLLSFVRVQVANSRPDFFFANLFIFHETLLKLLDQCSTRDFSMLGVLCGGCRSDRNPI